VMKITGYNPSKLQNHHPANKNPEKVQMARDWMSEVLQGIHKAQKL